MILCICASVYILIAVSYHISHLIVYLSVVRIWMTFSFSCSKEEKEAS